MPTFERPTFAIRPTRLLQHSYGVFVVFVTVRTVNWEFFADIAAASFDAFSPTSSLVVTECAFLLVDVAGAIVLRGYCATPRRLLETLRIFHILWAYTRRLLETGVY